MTQYLLSVHAVEGSPVPSPEEMQKAYQCVSEFNDELQSTGAWVFAGGLLPPSSATVVKAKDGDLVITDGPFVEGKEHIGGVWVIEATDDSAALAWAGKATRACGQAVEVRPFQANPED
ncbi:MAG TPA: YciI family protein [Acidimicrobiales bacterium]|jgi:hypothetical protein|nr:YciI family protein [Acidimicrobiales bacterium]